MGLKRQQPNIIITGTPGVGKTSHCEMLVQNTGLKHLSINQVVKEQGCHNGWDDNYQSWIVDEEKLLDYIEDKVKAGGYVIDWHVCDVFPESWIDLVVVLRTNSTQLYDRLRARNYAECKLQENLDSEIMEVILSEARESYDAKVVIELQSNEVEDVESNVERIEQWTKQWMEERRSTHP
ncbi:MAG: factor activating pos9 [Icmadophila ericetorum]|nr:factor activating pos9 [Icmadophila ericetorum]